jgi:hypothetical protein
MRFEQRASSGSVISLQKLILKTNLILIKTCVGIKNAARSGVARSYDGVGHD